MTRLVSETLLLVCLVLLGIGGSSAEDLPRPKAFFESEYAAQNRQRKAVPTVRPTAPAARPVPTSLPAPVAQRPAATAAARTTVASERGTPVVSIGAVINALDKKHLEQCLGELSPVLKRCKLERGPLYLLGTVLDYPMDELTRMRRKFGVAIDGFTETAPSRYPVKSSPSWILQTKQGQILLEAAGPLADYFDERCEFVKR